LKLEYADLSLIGDRQENQDRVTVVVNDRAALLIAVDGMGGHADGAQAAHLAVETISELFRRSQHPVLDPQGFLHQILGRAHAALVALGASRPLDARPRATCALCLVQDGGAYWGHVGDSRIYHLRGGQVRDRSRDHSHVEILLQEGMISEAEVASHPMRNYVEACLGGDAWLPAMTITPRKPLSAGDVLLVCSDGLWTGVGDEQIAGLAADRENLDHGLRRLAEQAVRACGPYSDNTSVAALRFT
jgi:PPM family protein phosphatase